MPTGTELEALKRIAEAGGKIDYRTLARKTGYNSSYMNIICRSLGKEDYIDYLASGMCLLTPKGEEECRKRGFFGGGKNEKG